MDQNHIAVPLESFPPIQPPNKPKYCNKAHKPCGAAQGQGPTSSFVSATGDGPDAAGTHYNQGGMAHGQSYTQLRGPLMKQQHQAAQVKFLHSSLNKNHHYSTSSKLVGPTSGNLIDYQNAYKKSNLKNQLRRQAQIIDNKNEQTANGNDMNGNNPNQNVQ